MQYRDRVLIETPIPLLFKSDAGALVVAYIQYADDATVNDEVTLTELDTPTGHVRIYAGAYAPARNGWYYVTFRASINDIGIGTDAIRFYAFTAEEEAAANGASLGEPLLQEVQVKIGTVARLAYRGATGLTVTARAVFEADLADPTQGVAVSFTQQVVPSGYTPLYLGSFSPTREGRYYVYVKSVPSGGEGLIVISAFNNLPYSRAAGTIKSSATSTVT